MTELIKHIEIHVTNLLLTKLPAGMTYHNIRHTREVVAAVAELTGCLLFNEWERQVLLAAAWFHDTGYCYGYDGHEAISMTLAGDFLRGSGVKEKFIDRVNDCIRATKMPQVPLSPIQGLICDADMRHLSLPDYEDRSNALRREWAAKLEQAYSDRDWDERNLKFMSGHRYFTSPAQISWGPQKLVNIDHLWKKLNP